MEINIWGMIGLYGGVIGGLLGWWFGRQKARKNRGLDELYYHIWQKARSYSWYVTLGALYVFFTLLNFGIELSTAMVLGILLLTHVASWGIIGIILTINMSSAAPLQPSRVKVGLFVFITSIIVFTIISILTTNWLFLLFSIPPNLIALFTALIPKRKDSEVTY
ncbi:MULTISPECIES: hypothetical protein [Lysinibacillus]|uniref:hypothetical protein n=1 Tax=Lysinibacillus TaxID=400634 RepID=UPI000E1FF888|nr:MULTISPECIES: hypothetical protein [Lysinibacillus]MED3873883.1 hypothetical protein [Lysinibacillus capsici]RDV30741.1 hypothetical protein C7B89_14840 [Lysinibacillus capsici]